LEVVLLRAPAWSRTPRARQPVTRRHLGRLAVLLLAVAFVVMGGPAPSGAQRSRPVKIGALSASWGPTRGIIGLREGLKALGYREDVDFVIGVRFTQGNQAELPAAARELVKRGSE